MGPRVIDFARRWFRTAGYRQLAGKKALEIGGPSEIFGDQGLLPIYSILKSADNCLFSARTIWTGDVQTGRSFQYHPRRASGTQLICEATDLRSVRDSTYEVVLASHCLEHIANPIRALEEWKRILVEGGFLLLVLPHKERTFDWRRPVTPLEHMIQDCERNTMEDDLTHLPEILALHDLEKDPPAGSREQFKERCLANTTNRAIHHHVFDTAAAVRLVDHSGFQLIRVSTFEPFHIIILALKFDQRADNSRFLCPRVELRTGSPFRSE